MAMAMAMAMAMTMDIPPSHSYSSSTQKMPSSNDDCDRSSLAFIDMIFPSSYYGYAATSSTVIFL
ncbi:hypothetical protein PJI17_32135, partial [Mycobacterium kansasii]